MPPRCRLRHSPVRFARLLSASLSRAFHSSRTNWKRSSSREPNLFSSANARVHGLEPATIGIGVAELVTPDGVVVSDATIRWKGLPIQERFQRLLPTCIEADVRAAARAEARWGAGAGLASFLYVTVGTGISSCLVLDGEPHHGARGLSGTFASASTFVPTKDGQIAETPPLERFAS